MVIKVISLTSNIFGYSSLSTETMSVRRGSSRCIA